MLLIMEDVKELVQTPSPPMNVAAEKATSWLQTDIVVKVCTCTINTLTNRAEL